VWKGFETRGAFKRVHRRGYIDRPFHSVL